MERNEVIEKYLPPRVIDAISAGFNLITKHLYLLLFPLSLDLFLWLGPKLRIVKLVEANLIQWFDFSEKYFSQNTNSVMIESAKNQILEFLHSFNLFSALNTFPIGVPTLINNTTVIFNNDMGNIELKSFWTFLLLVIGLSLAGLIFGIIFFRETSKTVMTTDQTTSPHHYSIIHQGINVLALVIILGCILFALFFILLFFTSIISLISVTLGQLLLMTGLVALAWIAIPAFYCCHDIFLHNQIFYKSFIRAYQIMGFHYRYQISGREMLFIFPKSIVFTMTALILYQGLNLVWRIPDPSSWLTLVGIVGHAFISSALLSASFIYFNQLDTWQLQILDARRQSPVK